MIAMTLSLAMSSTFSPNRVLTWDSLLKMESDTSRHRSHAEAVVCSFMKGAAILNDSVMGGRLDLCLAGRSTCVCPPGKFLVGKYRDMES